ncbi:carboxypeptidase-like regulatory domain-containing protein [Paraliomyxa miuraensis]|uniref:carboxypeptidase-like regulatory domain-containing protein n=1 Tax=Paraliomyxa miuraensis TaxID=376150 RepID=UPI00225855BE|nr:carboxypeptidase-like regulatory domain-containing protein [Paraliomyxa miuraensis]MCX4245152.1 carboxypeptidase-like regulatory domain-containing protein [Paraliomyxa miuraensis]
MIRAAMALLALLAWSPLATAAPCDVIGTVVGPDGQPLAELPVRLDGGKATSARKTPRTTTTDADGRFRFAGVSAPVEVVATLGEGNEPPRFVIVDGGTAVEARANVDPSGSCQVALTLDAHPRAADLLALHQGLHRGFAMMAALGIPQGPTLRVEADDAIADPHATYWTGTMSFNPKDVQPPRMVLGTAATNRDDSGAPDNREYHELGHHALATAFGALPRARDHVDGGGYHRNASSAGALSEGFAIFFAALVAREIEQRPSAGLYRVEGAWLDLELDYGPWDLRGTESIAVAGLLWDMIDGDRDARPSPALVEGVDLVRDEGQPPLLVARVRNPAAEPLHDVRVQVELPGWSGTALVAPAVLAPNADGWLAVPLPGELADREDLRTALQLRAVDVPAVPDDDTVEVEPRELWTAMVELRGERPEGNGRLFDVADLHQALHGRFGDQVDALFVAHGLHADPDGDHEHDADEAPGLTSHPGRTVRVDGDTQAWPAFDPRHRLALPAALRMSVTVEPAQASLAVMVSGSGFGGYLAAPDEDGRIRLLPPPSGDGATVSVVAMAPDRRPAVVWHREAEALLPELEQHQQPYLTAEATLLDASALASPTETAGSPRWPRLLFLGGVAATLLGLVLMAIGWPRMRPS